MIGLITRASIAFHLANLLAAPLLGFDNGIPPSIIGLLLGCWAFENEDRLLKC